MVKAPPKPPPTTPTPDYEAVPGLADTIRKLAQVPKADVDASMASAKKKPAKLE
jgi:hypothetical protein